MERDLGKAVTVTASWQACLEGADVLVEASRLEARAVLMDPQQTGLNAQLAARPGLDAGLVVVHKASIDLAARLKAMAQPLSVLTAETSGGQEDYMSMLFPVLQRTLGMCELAEAMFAYELYAALAALDLRGQRAGQEVEKLRRRVREHVPGHTHDRAPGPDVECILDLLRRGHLGAG